MHESAAHHPNQFLADLTSVMRATAETSRQAALDQNRADAKAYVERLRARAGAEVLRQTAEDDLAVIQNQSKASIDEVRAEAERRIARRRELLEDELGDCGAAVEREMGRVQERVSTFEREVSDFFEGLLEGADPAAFAAMASHAPDPPTFGESDLEALAGELRDKHEAAVRAAAAEEPSPGGSGGLPDHWWLDSPSKLAARAKPEPPA